MFIKFRDSKTFVYLHETNSDDLPIIPNNGDMVWLGGHKYKVKYKEFNVLGKNLLGKNESVLMIYVKPM